jgi:carbonic anhydrase/acetyltransferase-like protein (isoleucine patch superfamily)
MKRITTLILLFQISICFAQKTAYIPAYLLDTTTVDGKQFTWSKTLQSPNFTLIWGDSAGLNPMLAPDPNLVFNPSAILDTMENIYQDYLNWGFAKDIPGTNLHIYKIPIVMLNTFGPTGNVGWAYGGDADGVIGAFWAHPLSMQDGHVATHELAHSMQLQNFIDFRIPNALGIAFDNIGIFYETHANFMRNLRYPQDVTAWGMDLYGMEAWGQWKNTYENYHLLSAIYEVDSLNIINKMWREAYNYEYPIAAYKRLKNYSQQQLNDKLFTYARRMATLDFPTKNTGNYMRQNRADNMINFIPSVQTIYTILKQDSIEPSHYLAPIEIAPEEYGYNIIPLNPIADSCAVIVKFKGHTDANAHTGWRYGFVTELPNGTIGRYSDIYSATEATIGFSLLPTEKQMYLVVMGAPDVITTDTTNDTWKGYPKHFRFPYELTITGGNPEGHQAPANFRAHLKNNGHIHSNGGGWVANSANVSNSVYVAPYAMVMGNATISGNVKINNTAMVQDANISGNVQVKDNAMVVGGILSGNAIIAGQAYAENDTIYDNALIDMRARVSNYKLHGNIHVGGDVMVYNNTGNCDNGTYYRMTNYYQDNLLECDGRTATHPANLDVNNIITSYTNAQMNMPCNCNNYPNCLTVSVQSINAPNNTIAIYPNPATSALTFEFTDAIPANCSISIYNSIGSKMETTVVNNKKMQVDVSNYAQGIYYAVISGVNTSWSSKIIITH